MPRPEVVAQSIAAAFSAAGLTPHIKRQAGSIRVEVVTPESAPESVWRALLAALHRGDRFGMDKDAAQGSVAWAVIFTDVSPDRPVAGASETGPAT